MPLSRSHSIVSQITKKLNLMRRQRPLLLPLIIVASLILLWLMFSINQSTNQSSYQVLSVENGADEPTVQSSKLHSSRKSLSKDQTISQSTDTIDEGPSIDVDAIRVAMTKSLEQARAKTENVQVAALAQLKSELDVAIAAKRFERCAIIRDVMAAVEKQIADHVVVNESVDDYIGRMEHSLRLEPASKPAQEEQTVEEQQADEESANELTELRIKIRELEEDARAKHRVRMLANRARKGNSQIKISRMSHNDAQAHRAGIRSPDSKKDDQQDHRAGIRSPDEDDEEYGTPAGVRAPDQQIARAGIVPNRDQERDEPAGVKAGIHPGDIDHRHAKSFDSYEEAKAAADAAKQRYQQRFARSND